MLYAIRFLFTKTPHLFSPHLQLGLGFYYSSFGGKTLTEVPLAAPGTGTASVDVNNTHGAVFAMARCVSGHVDRVFVPYFDFFSGYRFLLTEMNITPYQANSGYEKSSNSIPANASGFMIGAGLGVHAQARIKKSYVLFDSELVWNYSPVHGTIANLSTLRTVGDGIYMDMPAASNSILFLKIGICFYDTGGESDEYNYYSSPGNTHCGGGSHSHSRGAHNSVHVHSGGGHAK